MRYVPSALPSPLVFGHHLALIALVLPASSIEGDVLPKAYIIVFYRSAPGASFAEYGELAIPAVHAGGGRILARSLPSKIYEAGMNERVTLIEFDSVEQAIAAREGEAYQAAFARLGNVVRDVRIIEAS